MTTLSKGNSPQQKQAKGVAYLVAFVFALVAAGVVITENNHPQSITNWIGFGVALAAAALSLAMFASDFSRWRKARKQHNRELADTRRHRA